MSVNAFERTSPVARVLLMLLALGLPSVAPAQPVDFDRDIRPLLREHCAVCHGATQQHGDLRLDRRQIGGGNAVDIIPGNASRSRLVWRISGSEYGPQMPPTGPLRADEIAIIRAWIDQGAAWPETNASADQASADARMTPLLAAFRTGDHGGVSSLLSDRTLVSASDGDGTTALMYAALYGTTEDMRVLLEHGANPNAHNHAGVTPLMWAAADAVKVQLLLERGADPRIRSLDGRTALLAAVTRSGSGRVVRLLLAHGADPTKEIGSASNSAVALAAAAADADTIQALVAAGAPLTGPISEAAFANAALMDCIACIDVLAAHDPPRSALGAGVELAAAMGGPATLAHLLDKGGPVDTALMLDGRTPLMLAAYAERDAAEKVSMLLVHGANAADRRPSGETAMTYATWKGDRAVVELLTRASTAAEGARLRSAVEKSIALLQQSDVTFVKNTGCISCHHQVLPGMLIGLARAKHLRIDAGIAQRQLAAAAANMDDRRERVLQGLDMPGNANGTAYLLLGLDAQGYAPTATTDAMALYVRSLQLPDGRFRIAAVRPPLETDDITATATAVRAISRFTPAALRADANRSVRAAVAWLAAAKADTTEEQTFRLLGLVWGGAERTLVAAAARQLTDHQRTDGGWGQIATLESDAYSTGQALYALYQAGLVSPTDSVYRKGVTFLLAAQHEDGSWQVKSRSIPLQVYFDSGFPYGTDQFISAAATSWAAIALTIAAPDSIPH